MTSRIPRIAQRSRKLVNYKTENAESRIIKWRQKLKQFNIMKATLFQTDKSVKILVFGEEEFSFDKRKNISYNDFRNFINSIFRK